MPDVEESTVADMYYHYRSAAFYYALGRWDEANPGGWDVNDVAADCFATAYMNEYSHMDIVDAWKVYDAS